MTTSERDFKESLHLRSHSRGRLLLITFPPGWAEPSPSMALSKRRKNGEEVMEVRIETSVRPKRWHAVYASA